MPDNGDGNKNQDPERRNRPRGLHTVVTVFLVLLGLLLVVDMFRTGIGPVRVSYSEFLEQLYTCQFRQVNARGDNQLVGIRKEGSKEVTVSCEIPLGEMQGVSADLIRFSGQTVAEVDEARVLENLENNRFEPVRCWVVPRDRAEDAFVQFYEQSTIGRSGRAQLARISPTSSYAVDFGRLRAALKPHGIDIERMNLGGSKDSFNYEPQNKLLWTLVWNLVPWVLILAAFWF